MFSLFVIEVASLVLNMYQNLQVTIKQTEKRWERRRALENVHRRQNINKKSSPTISNESPTKSIGQIEEKSFDDIC